MQPAWLRIAAAVVIVVGVGGIVRSLTRDRTPLPQVAGAELNDLSTDQLRDVLDAVERPAPAEMSPAQDLSLDDLSAPQLRALLESLES